MQLARKRNRHHPCHSVENVPVLPAAAAVNPDGSLTDLLAKIAAEYMDRLLYFRFSDVQMTTHVRFCGKLFHIFLNCLSLGDYNVVLLCKAQCRRLASRGWTKLWKNPVGHHFVSMTSSSSPSSSASFFTVSKITSPVTFTGIVEIQAGWYVNRVSDGAEAKT